MLRRALLDGPLERGAGARIHAERLENSRLRFDGGMPVVAPNVPKVRLDAHILAAFECGLVRRMVHRIVNRFAGSSSCM